MKLYFQFILLTLLTSFQNTKTLTGLTNVSQYSDEFGFDIRYASSNNFIGERMYDCSLCLLQPEVAEALRDANDYFCYLGYRIKIFDCYRPLSVQKKMWKKVPRATYVANPYKKGSIHNRAAAVDITLETLDGCPVFMGTDYDFFGREAHIDYFKFPQYIINNRKLLQEGMKKFGFQTIRTEWWHFSYKKNYNYPVLNIPFPCEASN